MKRKIQTVLSFRNCIVINRCINIINNNNNVLFMNSKSNTTAVTFDHNIFLYFIVVHGVFLHTRTRVKWKWNNETLSASIYESKCLEISKSIIPLKALLTKCILTQSNKRGKEIICTACTRIKYSNTHFFFLNASKKMTKNLIICN